MLQRGTLAGDSNNFFPSYEELLEAYYDLSDEYDSLLEEYSYLEEMMSPAEYYRQKMAINSQRHAGIGAALRQSAARMKDRVKNLKILQFKNRLADAKARSQNHIANKSMNNFMSRFNFSNSSDQSNW